ncbi:MAG: efflux RND transporter periplasmic adaptor subunit [Pyrinomonadaceae bacterium]
MKRLTAFLNRWRTQRTGSAPVETTTETVETMSESPRTNRNRTVAIVVGIMLITLATLLGLAYTPGVRETRVARAIRFWEKVPPPPAPAVPAGQLAVEMEQARTENPAGTVMIDASTAEALGLQTFVVEARSFDQPVRTTGRVTVDERRVTQVHTKVDGFIDQTFGNFEGQQIRQGQPLFTIYSPELVASQQEYLIALRARGDFVKSEFEVVRRSGSTLVEASRRRLQLFDVTSAQIKELERTGRFFKNVTFYAPASGVVTQRTAFPGMRITPDTQLYTLADLSTVWVEADVYESDLPNIRLGTSTEITLPNGETRTGRVTYVNPFVVPETRTTRVRLELSNSNLSLKPGMFVNVSLRVVQPPQVVVPRDAVLATGMRNLVLVDDGQGRFTLREIVVGNQGQEFYTVQSGLNVGERVARNIQFLIDSETQLRQAVEGQSGAPKSPGGANGGGMQGMPGMPGMK